MKSYKKQTKSSTTFQRLRLIFLLMGRVYEAIASIPAATGCNCEVYQKFDIKSLKVFRLKAAILGLQFVKSMMFNCSYFDKSILNVYSPMSPKMFLGLAMGQ